MTTELTKSDDVGDAFRGGSPLLSAGKAAHTWEITVNSRQDFVSSKEITFEQVVKLAYPNPGPETNVIYSVTYRHVASIPHAGELAAGGSVEVKHHGSIFNVARTIQS